MKLQFVDSKEKPILFTFVSNGIGYGFILSIFDDKAMVEWFNGLIEQVPVKSLTKVNPIFEKEDISVNQAKMKVLYNQLKNSGSYFDTSVTLKRIKVPVIAGDSVYCISERHITTHNLNIGWLLPVINVKEGNVVLVKHPFTGDTIALHRAHVKRVEKDEYLYNEPIELEY